MPLGKYILVADFVLTCDAGGLTDGHSAADFSPSASLPADWVRTRDPFQGVDKKDFGFKLVLTADPPEPKKPGAMAAKRQDAGVARTSTATAGVASNAARPATMGLDRHSGPR